MDTDWQKRLVDEEKELVRRINTLFRFVHSDTFKALDKEDQRLLRNQGHYMKRYARVLHARMHKLGLRCSGCGVFHDTL